MFDILHLFSAVGRTRMRNLSLVGFLHVLDPESGGRQLTAGESGRYYSESSQIFLPLRTISISSHKLLGMPLMPLAQGQFHRHLKSLKTRENVSA
jgi:hypothetical protein